MNEQDKLLAAARRAAEPDQQDQARVRAALTASLAAGAGAGVAQVAGKSGFFASGTGKLVLLVSALLVVGGGFYAIAPRSAAKPAPQVVPAPQVPAAQNAPAPQPAPILTVAAVATVEPPPSPEPVPTPPTRPRPRPVPAAAPPVRVDLAGELAILTRARAALREGDAEVALAALAEHEHDFPAAQLREEASALRVRALCAAGHGDEARTLAREFLRTWPSSPQAPGVRATCPAEVDKESP